MSDDNGKNPMPNDKDQNPIFAAFQNLNLYANYSNYREEGESSNINCNNNNPNLNVYNVGYMSAATFIAPPLTPPGMTQPGAPFSSNSGQPFSSPLSFVSPGIDINDDNLLSRLWDMMTCKERYHEFKTFLKNCDTYPSVKEERYLLSIVSTLAKNSFTFLNLATTQNGSKVLGNLLRRNPSLDHLIFWSVYVNFRQLMCDNYGVSLINPTIRAVDKPRKEMLYERTYKYTLELAKLEYGCVAINKVFEEIRGKYRDLIFDLVAQNAEWLSFDPYGTHVVQNFLTLHNPDATKAIAERLSGNFFSLAMRKDGSWVVEKCLNSDFARGKVLEEFRGNDKEWVRMAKDEYGNYVAQCVLRVMKKRGMIPFLREFLDKLRPHFGDMKIGYGNKTLQMIQKEGWIDQSPDDLSNF